MYVQYMHESISFPQLCVIHPVRMVHVLPMKPATVLLGMKETDALNQV